jgi:hypothetical protein
MSSQPKSFSTSGRAKTGKGQPLAKPKQCSDCALPPKRVSYGELVLGIGFELLSTRISEEGSKPPMPET